MKFTVDLPVALRRTGAGAGTGGILGDD